MKRSSQLKRGGSLARSPMRRKRTRAKPAREDLPYRAWVQSQPCCAPVSPPCRAQAEAHHPRIDTVGTGLRGPDHTAIALCRGHHVYGLHQLSGAFKGWSGERLEAWEREQIADHQQRYQQETAA